MSEALSASFVLSPRAGLLQVVTAADPAELDAGLKRLCGAIAEGRVNEAGHGYLVVLPVRPPTGDAGGAWLVRIRDGYLAAAFEFGSPAAAAGAVPPLLQNRSDAQVVEAAIWALAQRDITTVLSLLDDDFTYTDSVLGLSLTGAATAVNQLLLVHDEIDTRILSGLEIVELGGGIVQATGRIVDPQSPLDRNLEWTWKILEGVEDGRIKWTLRYPNEAG